MAPKIGSIYDFTDKALVELKAWLEPWLLTRIGGGGGHVIQDEGTPLAQRAALDFVGAGVTATDDSANNRTIVTIPGASASIAVYTGNGSPNGSQTGSVGDLYIRRDGQTGTTVYLKTSGTATNTGWTASAILGGGIVEGDFAFSDITTANASTSLHGLLRKLDNDLTHFLNGQGAWAAVKDSDLSTSDITTNNATTSKHGFLPKLDGSSAHYLNGLGGWTTPAAAIKLVQLRALPGNVVLTVNVQLAAFLVPSEWNGLSLTNAQAGVQNPSSSGVPTITVTNKGSTLSGTTNMLATNITIDATEYSSYTAATAPVVNALNATVTTADWIVIGCTVAGTNAKGLTVVLTFQ